MVWSSPPKTQPSPSQSTWLSNPNISRIPLTPTSSHEDSRIRSPKHTGTQHMKSPTTVRRLQDKSRSAQVQGRPSTATSHTTSSSYTISDCETHSRSPSPTPDDDDDDQGGYHSRSTSPIPRLRGMLPSPPQDLSVFSSQRTDESYFIPSAQPQTPIIPNSPQVFSESSAAASLPSPPASQEEPFHDNDSTPSTPKLPPPCTVRPQPRIQNQTPVVSKSRGTPQTIRSHRISRDVTFVPPTPESDDLELMDSVLEGIGRMHMAMGKDDAGRWWIKRGGNSRY